MVRKWSGRGVLATALCWLPVTAVIAALIAAPSSNGAAQRTSLNVSPDARTYGGQKLVFSGDMGNGQQRIFLQRRGCTSCTWSEVIDPRNGKPFTMLTQGNGEFRFEFPAPAMNAVYFRVHSRQSDTGAHQFRTVHQDADIFLIEDDPADVPLPRGVAVVGEDFDFRIDTVRVPSGPKRPALAGRGVELQERDETTFEWAPVARAQLGPEGLTAFQWNGPVAGDAGVYRVVLDDWTRDGDDVGWFASLPYHLDVVNRPPLVRNLDSTETSSSVKLTWTPPTEPVGRIVIARAGFGRPHPVRNEIGRVGGSATQFVDSSVSSGPYEYALYSVRDGIYSRVGADISVVVPDPKRGER